MANRLNLSAKFKEILGSGNVYFQPPPSKMLKYPAIVYSRSDIKNTFANDSVYKQDIAYDVTVIDENPDSEIVTKVSKLPKCRWNRHFASDGLNHDNFTIYE